MRFTPLLAVVVAASAGNAVAAAPPRASRWWATLDGPQERAPARGVRTLRPSVVGRVRVMGGLFRMGSTPIDMIRALVMCRKETLGTVCDELQNVFRAEGHAH